MYAFFGYMSVFLQVIENSYEDLLYFSLIHDLSFVILFKIVVICQPQY